MDETEKLTFNSETQKNLTQWLEGDYDTATKNEIRHLLQENPKEIIDAFYTTLSFGTAGLRGIMGVGCNRINVYTIRTATQGLANYINKQPKSKTDPSVFIGYDSRCYSEFFAEEAAKVLAANGIKVYLSKELRPTPLVSFGCRIKNCVAAIMITASHNPPQYNGFKVYWNDGAQVLSPHDKNIIDEMKQISENEMVKTLARLEHPLIERVGKEIDDAYLTAASQMQNCRSDNQRDGSQLKIIYSNLHGTGITLMGRMLTRWGFTNFQSVKEQEIPDGNFPTVSSPNPEELQALNLGIKQLKATHADLLIATDPDGDRVGVAVLHQGKEHFLNGNQIAALLLNHICESLTSKNKMAANAAFIKTITTTELFQAIADYYQKPCFNVLPGFKHIAEKIRQWEQNSAGYQFLFGAEEYGYLYGTTTRDKDAMTASALICEMALQAKLQNKTLIDQLHDLYRHYGFFKETTTFLTFDDSKEGREKIEKSMCSLRQRPPKKIQDTDVIFFEDYQLSTRVDLKNRQIETIPLPKSDILVFWLEDGSKLIIRPSGTEAKIKIYCNVNQKKFQSIAEADKICQQQAKTLSSALVARILTCSD